MVQLGDSAVTTWTHPKGEWNKLAPSSALPLPRPLPFTAKVLNNLNWGKQWV